MGSSIKINSISIDLVGATNEVAGGRCDHFSIRGFVAEICQRDRGKCWPFSVDGANLEDHRYSLPSLSVPKSRWWRCTNCLKDINAEGMNGSALREQKVDANVSIFTTKSDRNSPVRARKTEMKADNPGEATDGNENVNHDERCRTQDLTATLLKKNQRRSVDVATVGRKSRKLDKPELACMKSKETVNLSVEINWKEKREAVNGQFAEVLTTFGSSEIAGVVDDTPKAVKNHNNVSSESTMMIRNLLDHNPDNMPGLQRRKARKVRLLSELLGKSNTKSGSNIRNEESPSKKESIRGRKRKAFGDEEWRPPESTPENNYANRKLSEIGTTCENASQSCDSEGHVLSGIGSQPSVESQSTDSGFDTDPIKGKQKNRRFQVVDEHLPVASRDNSQKSIQEHDEGSSKCTPGQSNFPSSVHSSYTGIELVPCPLHTLRPEGKPGLAKKKIKKSLTNNNHSSMIAFSNSMVGGNHTEARKPELLQISSINAVSQSIQDVSNGKGFNSSVDKILASEGYAKKYISQLDQRPFFSLPSQVMHHRDDHVKMKEAETNFASPSKSNADGCLRPGVYIDLSCSSSTNRFLNEKRRHTPTEVADHSLVQQKDTSGAYNKGKGVLIQSNYRKEKTPEHIDDIPMEIVELMAKNQYERCLPDNEEDTKKNKQSSLTTSSTSKNGLLIDLNKTYENGVPLEENTSRQPKPHDKSMRKDEATKGEHFLTVKQNSVNFFPINQFGHPYVPHELGIFPLTHEKPSSSIQFSGSGSSGHSMHSCQWLGNVPTTVASQNPSPFPFQVLRPPHTCQSVPQLYREASHTMWPYSVVPHNQMPVSFTMPQKFMDLSTKHVMPSRGSNNDKNSWNLNFVHTGKQKRGADSELSFGCKHGGVSGRSLDPYVNESSIPAMHLLSLMDPRLRSSSLVDLPGNPKLPKRPYPQGHQSKEFLGLQPGNCSKTPNSTKQLGFDFYSKRSTGETSRETFPVISAVGTSSLSFQNDKSFAKGADFTVQASWKYPEKKAKTKDAHSPSHNSLPKSILTSSCDPGKFQLLGASDSMMLPLKFHTTDYAKENKARTQSCDVSALPLKSNSGPIMCSMNRNPADFTIPERGNIYMIRGTDLKFRKRGSSKKKPSLCKQDALKQNMTPVCPATENA